MDLRSWPRGTVPAAWCWSAARPSAIPCRDRPEALYGGFIPGFFVGGGRWDLGVLGSEHWWRMGRYPETIMIAQIFLASAAALAMTVSAPLDKVGDKLSTVVLEGLSQTEATSYDEYTGRLVLLEFFAHW